MANKFQKSVLERLEQEALRQKQDQKAKTKINIEVTEKPEENKTTVADAGFNEPDATAVEIEENKSSEISQKTTILQMEQKLEQPINNNSVMVLPDIGEYLRRDNQRLAKNKTFYLDSDVIEAIKTTAKSQNVTDSKLVNDILRRVLGLH